MHAPPLPNLQAVVEKDVLAGISKSRVDRAGRALRRHAQGEIELTATELEDEREIVAQFRGAHGQPMQTVKSNLAYHVNQVAEINAIGQRLKRIPTIEDKLTRHPKMALSRMQDVGGCRAVLVTTEELREVEKRLRDARGWSIKPGTEYDYIDHPKSDGYRAVHLIERRHGCQIEVQLRTMVQHAWAETVERLDRQSRFGELKLGRAPDHVRDYYALGAALLALRERNEKADPEMLDRFREMNRKVQEQARRRRQR